eukprot:COSAG01_NODE_22538_length_851_cov_1.410904_1_plen_21_part_10
MGTAPGSIIIIDGVDPIKRGW